MRTIPQSSGARPAVPGVRNAVDPKQGGGGGASRPAAAGAGGRNLGARIARLAAQGMAPAEIAVALDVPEERVAAGYFDSTDAAPDDLRGADKVVADSFPASDPPPGPAA